MPIFLCLATRSASSNFHFVSENDNVPIREFVGQPPAQDLLPDGQAELAGLCLIRRLILVNYMSSGILFMRSAHVVCGLNNAQIALAQTVFDGTRNNTMETVDGRLSERDTVGHQLSLFQEHLPSVSVQRYHDHTAT